MRVCFFGIPQEYPQGLYGACQSPDYLVPGRFPPLSDPSQESHIRLALAAGSKEGGTHDGFEGVREADKGAVCCR